MSQDRQKILPRVCWCHHITRLNLGEEETPISLESRPLRIHSITLHINNNLIMSHRSSPAQSASKSIPDINRIASPRPKYGGESSRAIDNEISKEIEERVQVAAKKFEVLQGNITGLIEALKAQHKSIKTLDEDRLKVRTTPPFVGSRRRRHSLSLSSCSWFTTTTFSLTLNLITTLCC